MVLTYPVGKQPHEEVRVGAVILLVVYRALILTSQPPVADW